MLKTLLMALFGKFAKSHQKEIQKAQKMLQSAQHMFAQALEEAEIADRKLDAVIEDAKAKMFELQKTIDESIRSKEKNAKFKEKIQQFIDLED
jgi:ribosomal protein L16 Arg81 hydroxylase